MERASKESRHAAAEQRQGAAGQGPMMLASRLIAKAKVPIVSLSAKVIIIYIGNYF
jgi:hypothetical protein